MNAFRTYRKVSGSRRIVVNDVPFAAGQDVEVLLLPRDKSDGKPVSEFKVLLKETQSLPHVRAISEQDIRDEIRAVRRGK